MWFTSPQQIYMPSSLAVRSTMTQLQRFLTRKARLDPDHAANICYVHELSENNESNHLTIGLSSLKGFPLLCIGIGSKPDSGVYRVASV